MIPEKENKKIALLICYYGQFPWYFTYFLHSCGYNQNVHFFILTDNPFSQFNIPSNVFFVFKTLEEIKLDVQMKLGLVTSINSPYKLCDFKPAYGFLFPDLIAGYDFWGYGDLDVIFGNIGNFITEEVLSNYDIISVRHDVLTGCFQLLKNSEKLNRLFMESKDYKKVFTSSKHYCFDETNFAFDEFKAGIPFYEIETEIESMMHVVKKMEAANLLNAYFDFHVIEGRQGKLKWENGTLTYKSEFEIMLYHLIELKEVYSLKKPPAKIHDIFYISPNKIYW